MKISVNLASRPFVELRPFFLRLRIIMAVLAVAALGLAIGVHVKTKQLRRAQAQMAELQNATTRAQQEKSSNEARMRTPVNAEVLDRAHFLNALFLRKSFSWTAVMMDLENVLPVGVQVTSIEPQVTIDGDVIIRLRVAGDRDKAVQLVRNLERSRRFLAPRLAGETSQAKEGQGQQQVNPNMPAGVEFDILASYNPLPANESYHYAKPRVAAATTAVTTPAVTTAPKRAASPAARPGVVLAPYSARLAPSTTPAPAVAAPVTSPAPTNSDQQPSRPFRRPMGPRFPQQPGQQPGQGGPQ